MSNIKDISKKGVTLIELVVVISIILIVSGISFSYVSRFEQMTDDIQTKSCSESIVHIIDYGKMYCRENKISGYFIFDFDENKIKFSCNNKTITNFIMPIDFSLYYINRKNKIINVTNNGMIGDDCTITYKNKNHICHNITISVGTSNVKIKD